MAAHHHEHHRPARPRQPPQPRDARERPPRRGRVRPAGRRARWSGSQAGRRGNGQARLYGKRLAGAAPGRMPTLRRRGSERVGHAELQQRRHAHLAHRVVQALAARQAAAEARPLPCPTSPRSALKLQPLRDRQVGVADAEVGRGRGVPALSPASGSGAWPIERLPMLNALPLANPPCALPSSSAARRSGRWWREAAELAGADERAAEVVVAHQAGAAQLAPALSAPGRQGAAAVPSDSRP